MRVPKDARALQLLLGRYLRSGRKRSARVVEIAEALLVEVRELPLSKMLERSDIRRRANDAQHPRFRIWATLTAFSSRVTPVRGMPPKYRLSADDFWNCSRSTSVASTGRPGDRTSSIHS